MANAAAQVSLRATQLMQTLELVDTELLDIFRSAIGQWMFGKVPGCLNLVELRGVGRQTLKVQARVTCTQGREVRVGAWCVDRGAIPDHDDVSANMFDQLSEKIVDILVRDILRMQTEVKAHAPALGADRQAADDGDASVVYTGAARSGSALSVPRCAGRSVQWECTACGGAWTVNSVSSRYGGFCLMFNDLNASCPQR